MLAIVLAVATPLLLMLLLLATDAIDRRSSRSHAVSRSEDLPEPDPLPHS